MPSLSIGRFVNRINIKEQQQQHKHKEHNANKFEFRGQTAKPVLVGEPSPDSPK